MIMSSCSISIRCQFSIFHSLPLRLFPQPVNTLSQSWALSCSGTNTGRFGTIEKIDRRKDHVKHFEFGKWVVYRHFRFLIFWFTLTSINSIDQISRHTYLHMHSPLPPGRAVTHCLGLHNFKSEDPQGVAKGSCLGEELWHLRGRTTCLNDFEWLASSHWIDWPIGKTRK